MGGWGRRTCYQRFYLPRPNQAQQRLYLSPYQVTCGPGPFSMASADVLSDQLLAAGFEEPRLLRFDAPLCMGRTVDEAIAFASDIGPAGESLRLARTKAAHLRDEITEALREALRPLEREDGVWATSSTWLVTASVPVAR